MDGMEVLQKLKTQQSTRNIPVVMLSASVSDEKISLDAGAEYFLKKPYDGKMLIATVRSAMNRASRAPIGSAS
jgi:DNA-binding response OmpR family regulator